MDYDHIRRMLQQASIGAEAMRHLQNAQYPHQRIGIAAESAKNLHQIGMQNYIEGIVNLDKGIMNSDNLAGPRVPSAREFRAIPEAFRVPVPDLNQLAVTTAADAARSQGAEQLRKTVADLRREIVPNLPTEALAAAQYASLQQLGRQPLADAARALTERPFASVQEQYAETMRRAADLLSNPDVRRMIELADPEELVGGALDTSVEAGTAIGEVDAEDPASPSLDPGSAADALLPYVSYAILMISVALAVASGSSEFAQYQDALTEALKWLVILERALKQVTKRGDK